MSVPLVALCAFGAFVAYILVGLVTGHIDWALALVASVVVSLSWAAGVALKQHVAAVERPHE